MTHGATPDDRTAGLAGHLTEQTIIDEILLRIGGINVLNTAFAGGADPTCANDSTAAIQAAIDAAGKGDTVIFPTGVYKTSAPLLVTTPGVTLKGLGPRCTMGGANLAAYGAIIQPDSSWSASGYSHAAAVLCDGTQGPGGRCSQFNMENIFIDGTKASPSTAMDGIATYGYVGAASIRGCGVNGVPNGNGFCFYSQAVRTGVQGITMVDCMVQSNPGGHGIWGTFGDGTISRCHTQGIGTFNAGTGEPANDYNGFNITPMVEVYGTGGDIRIGNCRGDLSSGCGFYFNIYDTGAYMGNIQVSNCTTQRNGRNGYFADASSAADYCPVYLSNCVAQGDGRDLESSAFRLAGPGILTLSNCASHVDTIDISTGVPLYAISTDTYSGLGGPVFLEALGGFYNAVRAFAQVSTAAVNSHCAVYSYIGHQWGYRDSGLAEQTSF